MTHVSNLRSTLALTAAVLALGCTDRDRPAAADMQAPAGGSGTD
jgi:hypothetical protein